MSEPASTYAAHAFHESLSQGRAAGDLSVTHAGFSFRSDGHTITLPLSGAKLTLGGASDRLVFIAHDAHPDWSIYTADRSILRDPLLLSYPELAASLASMRGKRARSWVGLSAVAAILIGIPLALVFNVGGMTRIAARQVPSSWETELGKTAFGQYQVQSEIIEDPETQRLLTQLTEPLTTALTDRRYTFNFHIAHDPTLNAFALPGGYVVLHTELILRADSAEELLGVVAHEISHVTEQHGTRNLIASAGIVLTVQALLGDATGLLGTLAASAPFLLTQKYSRGFEKEADETGFALLQRAQVNPAGMASFFEKVKAEEEKAREKLREQVGESASLLTQMPEFLSSHPATDARLENMRRLNAKSTGTYRDFSATFQALQQRVKDFAAKNPTEETP